MLFDDRKITVIPGDGIGPEVVAVSIAQRIRPWVKTNLWMGSILRILDELSQTEG